MKEAVIRYKFELLLMFMTLCGVVLFIAGYRSVVKITPVYIVVVLSLLWVIWQNQKNMVLKAWAVAGSIGFVSELIGVHTGMLFGDYSYGTVLGPKLFGVPVLVALLWALVCSVLWSIMPSRFGWWRVFAVSGLAVLYDVALEHFAVRFGLWSWHGSIPLSNAAGWALVAGLVAVLYQIMNIQLMPTKSVQLVLPMQSIFFIALLLLY